MVTTLNTGRADAHDLPGEARAVVQFWRDAGADRWFNKSEAFDEEFRGRFLSLHEAAARGELDGWARTAEGALALLILLDQFPRNAFRGTARMYETDARARKIAHQAVDNGLDEQVEKALRVFFYLPFSHSENIQDQRRGVERNQRLGQPWLTHALGHADIIERFGRFPHRNPLLGRSTTVQEQAFLDAGGFAG